jgi:hypothetical protein
MNPVASSIDGKLHQAIDINQLLIFQAQALREMILNPKNGTGLDPLGTIDAIIDNVSKNAELLKEARGKLESIS